MELVAHRAKVLDPDFPTDDGWPYIQQGAVMRVGPYTVAELYVSGGGRVEMPMVAVMWESGVQGVGEPEYLSFTRIIDQVVVADSAGEIAVGDVVGLLYDDSDIAGPFAMILGRYRDFASYGYGEGLFGDAGYGGADALYPYGENEYGDAKYGGTS